MAYDPNDPKDKEIVDGLIADATSRLQAKNTELIGELRDARKGGDQTAKIEQLEAKLAENTTALQAAENAAKEAKKLADKATQRADASDKQRDQVTVERDLKKALVDNKIADQFHEAVEAMFAGKAAVKNENGQVSVMVGDKTLAEALSEFATSDRGKHFIAAPANGGSDARGNGSDKSGAKTMTRAAFDALDADAKHQFTVKDGGTLTDT